MKITLTPSVMLRAKEAQELVRTFGRRVTITDVADLMDCDPSSARRYVAVLLDLGKLSRVWVRATNDKPAHYQFSIGKDATPVIVPAFAPRTNNPRYSQHDHEHQATVPARQIGMGRDPLVAALFGQAGAQAAA